MMSAQTSRGRDAMSDNKYYVNCDNPVARFRHFCVTIIDHRHSLLQAIWM